jgi:hypothetical protein
MRMISCESCTRPVPDYNVVGYGADDSGERQLCRRCFNLETAQAGRINFERVHFACIAMTDAAGQSHGFQFRASAALGGGILLEAFERSPPEPCGYEFAVLGQTPVDLFDLKALLLQRMRRGLAQRYLELTAEGDSQIIGTQIQGRITSDIEPDGVPILVIDGREVSWREFGRMLMTFEGFELRLDLRERSSEAF